MIEYHIHNPDFFIKAVASIAKIADHMVLQFGNRIRTYGMDGGRICLYEMLISKEDLEIIQDKNISIMIVLTDLQKVIQRLKGTDNLMLIFDDNRLTVKGRIANKNKTFRINIIDDESIPEDNIDKLSELELNSVFSINLSDFVDMMQDVKIYKESFVLETKGDIVSIKCDTIAGEMVSEIQLEFPTSSDEKCGYSMLLGEKILKELGSQDVIVSFGTDMPIMIFTQLSPTSFIKWYLAPRIE